MALYKRNGVWWFHFVFKGRHIQKSANVANKRDAETIQAAYRTKLAKGEVGIEEPKTIPTFNQAMKHFLEWSKVKYAAHPNSHRRYEVASNALLRYFGNKTLDGIKSEDVERFKVWRATQKRLQHGKKRKAKRSQPIRPATINRELALLKHLFNQNDELVPRNPVRKGKASLLDEDNRQTRVINTEEEKLYLMAASQPLQDIATLMLETGMRPEEVCRIRRENVHLEQSYLFNPYGKTKAAKRKVPLSDGACAIVLKRLDKVKGDYLFPGRVPAGMKPEEAGPIVKVNAAHTAALRRSKVAKFRLYDCRHTWATRMVQAGVDLVTLAAMLGHSRIEMVLRYAHPTEEHQFAAMQKRQRYMAK